MDYIIFLKENNKDECAFLCCARSEVVVLLDSVGMNPGNETLGIGFTHLEKGQTINLDNANNPGLKIRIDKITNGIIKFEYTDLEIANIPNLALPVRSIIEILKNG